MNTRPITDADIESVLTLAVEDESALQGRPSRLGMNDIRGWLARVDLEQESWLYEQEGKLVAVSWFDFIDDLGFFIGMVAQGAKGRGLGARIVKTGEACARERGAARAQTFGLEQDSAAAELFAGSGFTPVRRFYELGIELKAAPVVPALPEGFTLATFRMEDARPYYEALDAAFQGHWEHHTVGFDRWWEEKQIAHDFDPTLWFIVRYGDEIAGVIRNDPDRNGGGYVAAVGVQRAWRGKGVGRALLLRTFAEFYSRGVPRVTLGVDAQNPTGATKLYESVGMTTENAAVVYEKALA